MYWSHNYNDYNYHDYNYNYFNYYDYNDNNDYDYNHNNDYDDYNDYNDYNDYDDYHDNNYNNNHYNQYDYYNTTSVNIKTLHLWTFSHHDKNLLSKIPIIEIRNHWRILVRSRSKLVRLSPVDQSSDWETIFLDGVILWAIKMVTGNAQMVPMLAALVG